MAFLFGMLESIRNRFRALCTGALSDNMYKEEAEKVDSVQNPFQLGGDEEGGTQTSKMSQSPDDKIWRQFVTSALSSWTINDFFDEVMKNLRLTQSFSKKTRQSQPSKTIRRPETCCSCNL